ncbi:MAG TPA: hydroxymethylbilane synthase [Thermoleophilaceae bacterium]|nr:hydroxymethylbilane synthase [Thermoleophilaceae bacterium]
MATPLRVGTRGSALAVAQSTAVARDLEALGAEVELVTIRTSGDETAPKPDTEDKARFVKELEQALLDGEIDLAVHSAKDVPGELPDGLEIVAVPERADARDALCLSPGLLDRRGPAETTGAEPTTATDRPADRSPSTSPDASVNHSPAAQPLGALPPGATVGTASLRRRAALLALRPDLDVRELRGNVDTRLRRLADGELDAIVLATAGLIRLGRSDSGTPLPELTLVPAAGQGCLALEARVGDDSTRRLACRLTDPRAFACLTAERTLVTAIDATCHTPVGAHATIENHTILRLTAFVGTPDGATWIRDEIRGLAEGPQAVGADAADRLLAAGAADILSSAEETPLRELARPIAPRRTPRCSVRQMAAGIVYLVGAGPGDPGLMTRRSLELIAAADAILYDRLIPADALDGARADCELRYVGKAPGDVAMSQEDICALLVELGLAGRRVVRLKGGDPFVFGRGGEEAEALRAAGVPFEVVPGITAGVAAPAYAGIPVTHRDAATAVAFVTGHEAPEKTRARGDGDGPERPHSEVDWQGLAAFPGTLVFYMGVKNLPLIAEALIAAGREASEPAAVVRRGTLPDQRTVTGTLADIAERVAQAGLKAPAITVVGPAVGLRDTLAWIEHRPLHGRRVAVTRARAQASGLAARLRALGAEVVETPAIRIQPRPVEGEIVEAIEALRGASISPEIPASAAPGDDAAYSLVCFTSTNGVGLFFEALAARGLDARALAGSIVAAIGPGTARELEQHGVRADVVPPRSVAEALVEALADAPVEGRRVLVARAGQGRDVLPDALRERGADVDVVGLYDTVVEPLSDEQRAALADVDYVTFTSASSVRNLVESLTAGRRPPDEGFASPGRPKPTSDEAGGGTVRADEGSASPRLHKPASGDGPLGRARIVSIGPVTSEQARELGLSVDVEAERHDVDGLIDALVVDAAATPVTP